MDIAECDKLVQEIATAISEINDKIQAFNDDSHVQWKTYVLLQTRAVIPPKIGALEARVRGNTPAALAYRARIADYRRICQRADADTASDLAAATNLFKPIKEALASIVDDVHNIENLSPQDLVLLDEKCIKLDLTLNTQNPDAVDVDHGHGIMDFGYHPAIRRLFEWIDDAIDSHGMIPNCFVVACCIVLVYIRTDIIHNRL